MARADAGERQIFGVFGVNVSEPMMLLALLTPEQGRMRTGTDPRSTPSSQQHTLSGFPEGSRSLQATSFLLTAALLPASSLGIAQSLLTALPRGGPRTF